MRIDYSTNQFTIASFAATDGANYDQQNCKTSSFFSTFNSDGTHTGTVEHFFNYGYMQTTSNGRCQAEVHSSEQGLSNRNVILKTNNSFVFGSEVDADDSADYILTYASNNSEAYRLENYQNIGYREGVNYFGNESGEHLVFRSFSAGGSSLIVSLTQIVQFHPVQFQIYSLPMMIVFKQKLADCSVFLITSNAKMET